MRDRRVSKTKRSIQNAYLDLLRQKGTEKITISDIAREADIDRKTFYLHYDSTEDIIREYAEEKTRELLKRLTIKSFFSLSFDRRISSAGWWRAIPAWAFSGMRYRTSRWRSFRRSTQDIRSFPRAT